MDDVPSTSPSEEAFKGEKGRGQVNNRFKALQQGNWGALVDFQEKDLKKLVLWRENAPARKTESEEEKVVRVGREAAALISGGQIGKAMRRLLSNGVASVNDP